MAYSFQTFTTGQVLTAAQMNQVEVNIRDHNHGDGTVSSSMTAIICDSIQDSAGSKVLFSDLTSGSNYNSGYNVSQVFVPPTVQTSIHHLSFPSVNSGNIILVNCALGLSSGVNNHAYVTFHATNATFFMTNLGGTYNSAIDLAFLLAGMTFAKCITAGTVSLGMSLTASASVTCLAQSGKLAGVVLKASA